MQYQKQVICCIAALLLNVCTVPVLLNRLSLHQKLKLKLIQPDVISVSMPLPDNMSATEVQETFEILTSGFETQYPDFGIELKIYENPEEISDISDMYINYRPEIQTVDISEIARELSQDNYFLSFSEFHEAVPLSFGISVLYYDMSDITLFQKLSGMKTITPEQFPEDVVTDTEPAAFQAFLENPKHPVIFPLSGMQKAEQNPHSSGRVHMMPVLYQNQPEVYHSNFCYINSASSRNHQKIAMLWTEYLLSGEAQNILFAEHYGDLPVHRQAFDKAVSQHQEYYALQEIKPVLEENAHE